MAQQSPAKRAKHNDGFALGGHDGGVRPAGESDAAYVLKLKQSGTRNTMQSTRAVYLWK